ncbi:MAG: PEGA domain-containing protein [Myxococcota bacterium]|nr:PEGA domain-containing protein [Myxococcota bacterium]
MGSQWFLLAVLSALLAGPAMGQDNTEKAAGIARDAATDYRAQRYQAALEKYLEASKLLPNSSLDINIGLCYEKLERPEKAMFHCKIALNAQGMPGPIRHAAQKCVDRVKDKLTPPNLVVRSTPSGATVKVDGQLVGQTPWRGSVAPGLRIVDVELLGHRTVSRRVSAKYTEDHQVNATLIPNQLGALLSLRTIPNDATVMLDGQMIGQTPLDRYPVAPRNSVIEISKDGFSTQVMSMAFADGSHLDRSITLVPQKQGRSGQLIRWPGWVLVGLGAAALGAGGYFGYRAFDERQKADRLARTSGREADRAAYENAVVDMDQFKLSADLLYAGGLLVTGGGITWLLWPSEDED